MDGGNREVVTDLGRPQGRCKAISGGAGAVVLVVSVLRVGACLHVRIS